MSTPTRQNADEAILRIADAIGGLMEHWGFKRNMGRLWTVLYLEGAPLSAAELGDRLSLSSGAVSMILSELTQWGAIKKAWVPGERRDYYEAETNIWKMVSRVFRERELRLIRNAIEAFTEAISILETQRAAPDANQSRDQAASDRADRAALAIERTRGLLDVARIGERLLDAMLSGESVDVLPLKSFVAPSSDE